QFGRSWRSSCAATRHQLGRALRCLCLHFDESYEHPQRGHAADLFTGTCMPPAPSGCAPVTTIVSVDSSGNALAGSSQLPAISDDGRFIVFNTQVSLAGGGITNDVFIHDTCNSSSGPVLSCMPSTNTVSIGVGGAAANGPSDSTPHAVSG